MRLEKIQGKLNIFQIKFNIKPFSSHDENPVKFSQCQNDTYIKKINFKGINAPPKRMLEEIILGLKGKGKNSISPDYICEEARELMAKYLSNGSKTGSNIYESISDLLQEKKMLAENFQSLLSGNELNPKTFFAEPVKKFLNEIEKQLTNISQTAEKVGLKDNETNYLRKIITESAPTLFLMGHSDAIEHASQVCRKCMIDTKRQNANNFSVLQSGIVGWLHDPKFSSGYSYENLATHPIIAGALLKEFISSSEKDLEKILKGYDKNKTINQAIKEMQEALYINNDSSYIVNKVLLSRMPGFSQKQQLSHIVNQRLSAASNASQAPAIPEKILAQISDVQFNTGIRKIDSNKFNQVTSSLLPSAQAHTSESDVLKAILSAESNTKLSAKNLIVELKKIGAVSDIKIGANYLFTHQQELESANFLGENLVNADLLMLSPQKILKEGYESTIFGRINSFCDSFNDNIKYVSKESQQEAQKWQKEVYKLILDTIDELNNVSKKDYSKMDLSTLQQALKNKNNWGEYASVNTTDTKALNDFTSAIEMKYKEILEKNQDIMRT